MTGQIRALFTIGEAAEAYVSEKQIHMKNLRYALMLLALLVTGHTGIACTTFCLKNGHNIVVGKNYDFYSGVGHLVLNKRNIQKTSYPTPDGKPVTWIARYGSISFNQFGKEFPCGGMNEKGLVVESMWLDQTEYPGRDARRGMFELQWIQYQLDNAESVAEVLASDTLVRISRMSAPIHFLIADAQGNTAIIEFMDGKTVVHTGDELTHCALANSPYTESASYFESISNSAEDMKTAANHSNNRFSKAAAMTQEFEDQPEIDYAFSVLDAVRQGDFTQWNIVYDITSKTIHYKTKNNPETRKVSVLNFDFSCESPSVFHGIDNPVAAEDKFLVYSYEKNRETIFAAFDALDKVPELHGVIPSKDEREILARYPESVECRNATESN